MDVSRNWARDDLNEQTLTQEMWGTTKKVYYAYI